MAEDPQARAERLRVLLAFHQDADSLGAEACRAAFRAGLGPTSDEDMELMATMTDEEHQLGLACFEIEADLRGRGWAALERLAAVLAEPDINAAPDELPGEQIAALVKAVLTLGWRGTPPSEP